ncbi:site-specific integrase [Candidatus Atribacteria bacterium 1244-E10-H5-B2]|nr:MAG: site-specific integrase [Candidatus Atribacteria bacterium 1244-E10-H5-B2]
MNFVEPIRDKNKIRAIKGYLKDKKNPRDFLLFTIGINTGLRISDLLNLQVRDVRDNRGEIRNYIWVKEKKTSKSRKIPLNAGAKEALQYYFNHTDIYDLNTYLFKSVKRKGNKPLTNCGAWQLVKDWCQEVGITDRVGCHSLRKTLGYHLRMQGASLSLIAERLGHSNLGSVKSYIGINDDEIEKSANGLVL